MYKIKLDKFEGPLDLLLFFVRKDELNIYDIPIAHITKSYLEYLKLMHELNLDIASEFILMAATLMRIKVRCMLPPEPGEETEEEPLDPREELTRRLIEYRQFKEASRSLSELDDQWRMIYRRNYFDPDRLPPSEEPMGLKNISFFDLLTAYKKAVSKTTEIIYHDIERLNVTVEQQIKYIGDFFDQRNGALFTELCEGMSKIEIVVTFLALLDMIRNEIIFVRQSTVFDDIWIQKERPLEIDLPEPIEKPENSSAIDPSDENIPAKSLPKESEKDEIPLEEIDLAQKELTIEIDDTYDNLENELSAPVQETELTSRVEDMIDISCLTDQLKSQDEITDIIETASVDQPPESDTITANQETIEPINSTEKWIDDIQTSLDHAQLQKTEQSDEIANREKANEDLTKSDSITEHDVPYKDIDDPVVLSEKAEKETVEGKILDRLQEPEIADTPIEPEDMRVEEENAGLHGEEKISDDRICSEMKDDVIKDLIVSSENTPNGNSEESETVESDLLIQEETLSRDNNIEKHVHETSENHLQIDPQPDDISYSAETVTEEALHSRRCCDADEDEVNDEKESSDTNVSSQNKQTEKISVAPQITEENELLQPPKNETCLADTKTTDIFAADPLQETNKKQIKDSEGKNAPDEKTSVLRKIFTKVLSFVKKIFKR